MKTVFVHPERCIGCRQCEAACAVAHSESKNLFLAVFESPAPKPRIHVEPGLTMNTSFPNKCRHCNPAPCMTACPTGAIYRPSDYPDIVLIEARKCIACGMCAMVCPFDVISYHASPAAPEKAAVALKCDHCIDRQRQGQIPACVETCKVEALQFGEINELVKASRTRYSEFVSVAVGQVSTQIEAVPANVTAWRGFGAAVTHLNTNGKKGA
ncbi:MAG: 4Fe-4S dicluster domain-containing protein [Anaerolineae bacterium]|nr:MAG: 4Fe-4S dicluster domain-containing protein [Anaerolineae bacterium]